MTGGMAAPAVPLACTGPVSPTGHERPGTRPEPPVPRLATRTDQVSPRAVAPSGVGGNEYYPTEAASLGRGGRRAARGVRRHRRGGLHPADRSTVPDRRVQLRRRVGAGHAGAGTAVRERDQPQPAASRRSGAAAHLLRNQRGSLRTTPAGRTWTRCSRSGPGRSPSRPPTCGTSTSTTFELRSLPRDAVPLPGVISHATNIVEHPDTIADRIGGSPSLRRPGTWWPAPTGRLLLQATYRRRSTRRSSGPSSSRCPRYAGATARLSR
jgi:hypothetical protein